MKKINMFMNIIIIITIVLLHYCFWSMISYDLSGKICLKINNSNCSEIINLMGAIDISISKAINEIQYEEDGWHEWNLVIKYEDNSEDRIHIYSHEFNDLKEYITENGVAGGDEAIKNLSVLKVSFIMIVVFMIYKIFYWYCKILIFINKKTNEIIRNQNDE